MPAPCQYATGEPPALARLLARLERLGLAQNSLDLVAIRKAPRERDSDASQAALTSTILNLSLPRGVATSTVSPFLRPMIA